MKKCPVTAICTSNKSSLCRKEQILEKMWYERNVKKNDGKYICIACSKAINFSGRNHPGCKYKDLNDSYFSEIDSWEKAYILGWIASDGSIYKNKCTLVLKIQTGDIAVLEYIASQIKTSPPYISKYDKRGCILSISSKQICTDVCRHLNINGGKKFKTVSFPKNIDKQFYKAFIQGYFEGDGHIFSSIYRKKSHYLKAGISSSSLTMLEDIKNIINPMIGKIYRIKKNIDCMVLQYSNNNAIPFLDYIYDNNDIKFNLARKYRLYKAWKTYEPTKSSCKKMIIDLNDKVMVAKTDVLAIFPINNSNNTYNLTLIKKIKDTSPITSIYSTGLKFQFKENGAFVEIKAKQTLLDMGYTLTCNSSIIDQDYMGTVYISLTKINDGIADIEMPANVLEIIA